MTTRVIDDALADDLLRACLRIGLRLPEIQGAPGPSDKIAVWTPDLTATEADLLRAAIGGVRLSLAERNALQPDIDLLVTFQGIASPTLAQAIAATKAQSRILRAMLRS